MKKVITDTTALTRLVFQSGKSWKEVAQACNCSEASLCKNLLSGKLTVEQTHRLVAFLKIPVNEINSIFFQYIDV